MRTDSGGAGKRRGGLGYEKHYRALVDCRTIVTADRVRLGCYGVNGGKAGQPFCVTVDIDGTPRDLGGLVDGEPVLAGQVVRVVTTGGGGWGDPLEREPDLVERDVIEGKVSPAAARADYGVVLEETSPGSWRVDAAATAGLRDELRHRRGGSAPPMIDRGPGYEQMLRGECAPRMRNRDSPALAKIECATSSEDYKDGQEWRSKSRRSSSRPCRMPPGWSSASTPANSAPTR